MQLLSKQMAQYLEYRAFHQGSPPGSIAQYDLTFRSFVAYLTTQKQADDIRSFTPDNVLGWSMHERKREKGISARTLSLRLSHLSGLAEHLIAIPVRGKPLMTTNPVKAIPRPRFKRKPVGFLLPDELVAFLSVKVPAHSALARDVLLDTMLRVSEVAHADVGHLLTMGQRVYLEVTVKGGATKRVPISPDVAISLGRYLTSRGTPGPTEPLLLNSQRRRWDRKPLSNLMARIGKRAGITRIRVSAHKIRHTANVVARRGGVDQLTRSVMLNHSNTRTIEAYDHVMPDEAYEGRLKQREGLRSYLDLGGHSFTFFPPAVPTATPGPVTPQENNPN
jgi:integrase